MTTIHAGTQHLSNRALAHLSPDDFSPGPISCVSVYFIGKKSEGDREWMFFKSLPGLLCEGKSVLCATSLGNFGEESLRDFGAKLPDSEVIASTKALGHKISMEVYSLSERNLPAFASLLWNTLMGIEVALGVMPSSIDHVEDLLTRFPRPLFRRPSWGDFWMGASRRCELTMSLNDGHQLEVYSSKLATRELEAVIRAFATRFGIDLRAELMRTQVEFRSAKFPPYDGEEEGINPGIWGKRLAEYLQQKLRAEGIDTGKIYSEDWGWAIPVKNDAFRMWIGCGHQGGDDETFLCFIKPSEAFIWKLFREIDTTTDVERVTNALDKILTSDGEIQLVRWRTEDG